MATSLFQYFDAMETDHLSFGKLIFGKTIKHPGIYKRAR